MSLVVRRAHAHELVACADLYDRVVRATFTWLDVGDPRGKFLKEAEEEEVFVALDDGRLVGLAAFYRPETYLHSLYVDASVHGRGVGSALLDHVQSLSEEPLSLKAQALNAPARRFYDRKGFVAIDEGQDPDGSRWVRMRR
ncbi:MAG TPA: GNAT family N-acetyltransferase [Caulobacteraceae bacterium]|nr:GNAT family N-acetyltransferase [Caulobacteraceae bacterium]